MIVFSTTTKIIAISFSLAIFAINYSRGLFSHHDGIQESLENLKIYSDMRPRPNPWIREEFLRLFGNSKSNRLVWHTLIRTDRLEFIPGGLFDEGNGEIFAYVLHVLDNPHEWRLIEAKRNREILDEIPF